MRKLTTSEFIVRACAVHGNIYDYTRVVYQSMHENVEIRCSIHGSFFQTPSNHLKGAGCSLCTKSLNRRLTEAEVLRRFTAVHGDTYDYSLVKYELTTVPVEIICRVHGPFWQTPAKHMKGHGCPLCAKNHTDTKESFIEKARKVHGDLYDYSQVDYVNSQTKVCIIDKEYGEFWQFPYAHVAGKGHWLRRAEKTNQAKRLHNTFHVSAPEDKAYALLCEKFGTENVKRQYSSEQYPFSCDFYVVQYDLYIEMNLYVSHGFHWFDANNSEDIQTLQKWQEKSQNSKLYAKMIYVWTNLDLRKRQQAQQNDLNYVVFWKNDLSDFLDWYNHFEEQPILKFY